MKPLLTLIAAVARNGIIGRNNTLPWRLPEDLKHFKALTTGHPIVMGRKTWESLGQPLPGRHNIVITRDAAYHAAGATVVNSLEGALHLANDAEELFVIGGAEIYRLALPLADRLQLTELDADFAGDTHFPDVDRITWRETIRERHRSASSFDYAFVTYERRTQST
ncbi:Dihydrofolate reductase type 3 [Georgfuchsia toluolica]|uniref:Dihydrofolate reductase n=1 Tax=Georgfuchsia toluolica TaxID=424218 RepID=A0A916J6P4_9PROT|nr:dihydrofolate reductase [Georgfuchsia toluolica]CAG4884944.1 Dihydrofolate reductase type 3 [Georgfuchsia toluolica]